MRQGSGELGVGEVERRAKAGVAPAERAAGVVEGPLGELVPRVIKDGAQAALSLISIGSL